jgi:dihydropteroate synthase
MQRDPLIWRVGERDFDCSEKTLVMGILNITPDSFSDGGQLASVDAAVSRGVQMVADGADLLDVGGESTRPGSDPVPADEEMTRTLPVIERLVVEVPGVPVSIDTRKAEVAAAALAYGASVVNDVSAGEDPAMFAAAAAAGAAMVLMHMQGDPKTMQSDPHYDDVVNEVVSYLGERLDAALAAGLERDALVVDPGIGFGKALEHNLALMKNIGALSSLSRPVLVGPSRKRFIGTLLGTEVDERLEGTAGAVAWLVGAGAHIVRVHDVKEMARVVRVVDAIVRA